MPVAPAPAPASASASAASSVSGPGGGSGGALGSAWTHRPLLLFYAGWNYDVRMKLVKLYQDDEEVVVRKKAWNYNYH